jgi:hypothetical protein
MLVHVDQILENSAGTSFDMGFDVDGIHVVVPLEREWKPADSLSGIAEGKVVAKGFLAKCDSHVFS